ncbi:centrosomal protein of 68 kDa isoform X2 [Ambystoma mexicanum]|uniref:centrosomal protein of 68 kDa isoform X2 n=1 Tax=Ambystoma mexicanum TaxID=8296 RepID=UPI0037E8F250
MALVVENPAALLTPKSRSYGRWNYAELDADYPELVTGVRQLLEIDESKSSCDANESVRAGRMYATPRKLVESVMCRSQNEESPTSVGFSKGKTQYVDRKPQLSSATRSSVSFCRTSIDVDHSHTQQRHKAELSLNEDYLLQSRYRSPLSRNKMENLDFSGIQRTFPSYSSSPKTLLSRAAHHSEAVSPKYSKSYLSAPSPEADHLPQERTRSRSLSAARCSSSDMFTPSHRCTRADTIENCLVGTRKSVQRSLSCAVEADHCWKPSPFQADYWACALPNSLPPSPDRQSPHWNPDKEYQDLLDYTYPLNSKHMRSKEKSKDVVPEPFLYDSGIGLDSFIATPDHTLLTTSYYADTEDVIGSNNNLTGVYTSPPQQLYTKLSNHVEVDSDYEATSVGKVCFENDSYYTSREDHPTDFKPPFFKCTSSSSDTLSSVDESEWFSRGEQSSVNILEKDSGFVPTTRVLQLNSECDSDDEYLSLPPRLKELENLAQQVNELSLLGQESGYDVNVRNHRPCISSIDQLSSKNAKEIEEKEYCSNSGLDSDNIVDYRFLCHQPHVTNMSCSQGDAASELGRLSSLRSMLVGISTSENLEIDGQHQNKEAISGKESLVQCIKMFCHKLEELIQWLYKLSDVAETWVPPKPDVKSIQSALHLYLKFKKDVSGQQVVAENVIKLGEILLNCIASNSPVLKDAIALISKKSEELESHGERLYASVLGAMDLITDSNLRMNEDTQHVVS